MNTQDYHTCNRTVNGREYICIPFKGERAANAFLKENPEWGVIDEERGSSDHTTTVYVTQCADKGALPPKQPSNIKSAESVARVISFTDLTGQTIEVTDIDKAITQAEWFSSIEDSMVKWYAEGITITDYWKDVLQKLIVLKKTL